MKRKKYKRPAKVSMTLCPCSGDIRSRFLLNHKDILSVSWRLVEGFLLMLSSVQRTKTGKASWQGLGI